MMPAIQPRMLLSLLKVIFFDLKMQKYKKYQKNLAVNKKSRIFAPAFNRMKVSSGVMAALQILVLPVKVRILARQLSDDWKTCYECNRFFYWKKY